LYGISTVVLNLAPLAIGILIVECPRLWCAEVAIVMIELEPVSLPVRYLVLLVELVTDSLGSSTLQPPVVIGL
jgi:hypothetical protein